MKLVGQSLLLSLTAIAILTQGATAIVASTCGCVPQTGVCEFLTPIDIDRCDLNSGPCTGCRCVEDFETPLFTCDIAVALKYEFTGLTIDECTEISTPIAMCPAPTEAPTEAPTLPPTSSPTATPTPQVCQTQRVRPNTGNYGSSDYFGSQVQIVGDVMVIGATDDAVGVYADAGSIYIFNRVGTTWSQSQYIPNNFGTSSNDQLGYSIAFDGSWILSGAPGDNNVHGTDGGAAYFFSKDGTGSWVRRTKIIAASEGDTGDRFGSSVAISGTWALIGAPGDRLSLGSVYFFKNTGGNTWTQDARIYPSTSGDYIFGADGFGTAVSIHNNLAVIGAPYRDERGTDSGAAYIYQYSGTTWSMVIKLLPASGSNSYEFGRSVLIKGTTVIVGSPKDDSSYNNAGAVYPYELISGSWQAQSKILRASASGDQFGTSLAMDGNTLVVGSMYDDSQANNAGAAYVFQKTGTTFTYDRKFIANGTPSGTSSDNLGFSCAVSDEIVACGAPYHNAWTTDSGAVFVFCL